MSLRDVQGAAYGFGGEGTTLLPSMAERTLALWPGATASSYDGVGHMPFWEVPDRFDHELAGLARNAAFMTTSTTPAG